MSRITAELPTAPPPARGGLSPRARWWLVAATVGALVLTYLVAWGAYAAVHQRDVVLYRPVAAGAVAETPSASIRLVSLTVTPELADQKYSGDPTLAASGATWVVAELEVTTKPTDGDPVCEFSLIGPDGRRWPQETLVTGRVLPTYCIDDSIVTGRPARIEAIYQVPDTYANRLVGLGVFSVEPGARALLLRPS